MSTDATPEDVYLAAEAAWLDSLFGGPPPGRITVHMSRERQFRAAIDAARAPLLAELAEVTRQRDEALATLARIRSEGKPWTPAIHGPGGDGSAP